ncbi:MAG: hypothetical protein LBI12_02765 [Treponema sp.]|jgi:hypothetical protein|nr:hypothetical protein [Treponema sp.]
MKRIYISIILFFFGMTAFTQDMSNYTSEFRRVEGTFVERLLLLEVIRDAGMTGIGEFYHDALKYLLQTAPNITNREEQDAAEKSTVILCQGLGAERVTAAAQDLWLTVVLFDVAKDTVNEGNAMQAALIALGQVGGTDFIPHIVQRLTEYNSQTFRNAETRRRMQMAVIGCINALEVFQDVSGYRPVFFVAYGAYDTSVKQIALNALPNIVNDPADVIIELIQNPSLAPDIKLVAWNEMLRSKAPNSSKARVAAVALETGWTYSTTNQAMRTRLSDMRKSAIDIIRQYGVADDSVYANLERSYNTNFINNTPDFDEIMLTMNALAAIRSDEAVEILHKILQELNLRRHSGPWGDKERLIFQWAVSCISVTETKNPYIRLLLTTITRADSYTPFEQSLARDALRALGN